MTSGGFDAGDVDDLLVALWQDLTPGTLAAAFGQLIEEERRVEKRKLPLLLDTLSEVPQTRRIDGLMPIDIPRAGPLGRWVSRLMEDVMLLEYDMPEPDILNRLEADLAVWFILRMHRRILKAGHEMNVEMRAECPWSPSGGLKSTVSIMGHLPNARRVTLWYTSVNGNERLCFSPMSLGYVIRLAAVREEAGLMLVSATNAGNS